MPTIMPSPVLWRDEKIVPISGHTPYPHPLSPVSLGFIAPAVGKRIRFLPDVLAASMARTLMLRSASNNLLAQWAKSQLSEVQLIVADGGREFRLTSDIFALGDDERSGFAGRVGAGITDIVMNSLGYVWRDNASSLAEGPDPRPDFIYGGGQVGGHGVVLAEAHGSFAKDVNKRGIGWRASDKYRRQVKPYIGSTCQHGDVIHGYSIAFGSNPFSLQTFLHITETRDFNGRMISPSSYPTSGSGSVSTTLAMASHRANFLLMGSTVVVSWIDWLRGVGERPAFDISANFYLISMAGQRFVVAAEWFFPFIRAPFGFYEPDLGQPWYWGEFNRWRQLQRGFSNFFAMEERAAKSFFSVLSDLINGEREQGATLELPTFEPVGLSFGTADTAREADRRYPIVRFADGLALVRRLPGGSYDGRMHWWPQDGVELAGVP